MTTTVTVETHDWPVEVTSSSSHSYHSELTQHHGHSQQRDFVPSNSKRTFTVTDTTAVSVRELPKEADRLDWYPAPDAADVAAKEAAYQHQRTAGVLAVN